MYSPILKQVQRLIPRNAWLEEAEKSGKVALGYRRLSNKAAVHLTQSSHMYMAALPVFC